MTGLADARGARWRLAWVHADQALGIAKALERDPDAFISVEVGLACVAAWKAFCEADNEYRKAKEMEDE